MQNSQYCIHKETSAKDMEVRERVGRRGNSLPGLIPQAAPLRLLLAASHDVPDQPLPAVEALPRDGRRAGPVAPARPRPAQGRLDQRPAPAHPVAVAPVDELVRAPGEAALRGVLPRGEPRDEPRDVEVSARMGQLFFAAPPFFLLSTFTCIVLCFEPCASAEFSCTLPCRLLTGHGTLDVPRDDAVRGVEDGEATQGTEGVCAVCLGVRLARYAALEGLAWLR